MQEHEKQKRAKRQVAAITSFYTHLAVFAAVMTFLLIINMLFSSNWWVQWPFFGWGAFVALHGVAVFARVSELIRDWKQKKVRELTERM